MGVLLSHYARLSQLLVSSGFDGSNLLNSVEFRAEHEFKAINAES